MYGKTKEELLQAALETNNYNTFSMMDITIKSLIEDGVPDEIIEQIKEASNDQIVITNMDKTFGASAIYRKDLLKEIADKFESDLYIIPSSIHELIVMPINDISRENMDAMVNDVNENEVDPTERLSNHIYIFRRDTMEIEW